MVDKALAALNLADQTGINYTAFLGAVKAHMMAKGHRE